jgi:copper homeostasis protein
MNKQSIIEICATNIQSAIAAQKGGAKRIEFCDNLYEGGTTPSYAAIKLAMEKLDIQVNVMIRPRGSDFCYDDHEFEIMKEDIRMCKQLGVNGVVFGILLPNGNVDTQRTKELVELSRPLSVTFHRAFDLTPDPVKALEDIINCGVDRLLTAGQQNKAPDGMELIAQLVKQANRRIVIMPGSGLNEHNIKAFRDFTGATEFHMTGRKPIDSKMVYRKDGIYMGGLPQIPEFEIFITDANMVQKLVQEVKRANEL